MVQDHGAWLSGQVWGRWGWLPRGLRAFQRPPFWLSFLSPSAMGHHCPCSSPISPPRFNSGGLCVSAQAGRENARSSVGCSQPRPPGSFPLGVLAVGQVHTCPLHPGLTKSMTTACQSWHLVGRPRLHPRLSPYSRKWLRKVCPCREGPSGPLGRCFESLEGKKQTFCGVLVIGGGRSELRSKEDMICWPPAFHGDARERQKSLFSDAHNGSLLRGTKPSSFVFKGPPDLPSVRPGLFGFPPLKVDVVGISRVFIVGPTVNPFQSGVRPHYAAPPGLGWEGLRGRRC